MYKFCKSLVDNDMLQSESNSSPLLHFSSFNFKCYDIISLCDANFFCVAKRTSIHNVTHLVHAILKFINLKKSSASNTVILFRIFQKRIELSAISSLVSGLIRLIMFYLEFNSAHFVGIIPKNRAHFCCY